jgi:hypothetical protein
VGRFACDWHRLPRGSLPGNHRPRLGHRRIITTGRNRASERARCRQHAHLAGSGSAKGERTGRDRGPARQDVVDEQDPWSDEAGGHERAAKRLPARRARPPRLGRRLDDAVEQPPGRPSHRPCHGPSQGLGLVVATRSTPASGERHPRDGGRFGIRLGRRRPGQGPHHPRSERSRSGTKAGELESHERDPNRPLVQEGSPRPRHWCWRAVRATIDRLLQWPAARTAPRRNQQGDVPPTRVAERPCPSSAAHAGRREERIEHPSEHERSVRTGSDTACRFVVRRGSEELHRHRLRPRTGAELDNHLEAPGLPRYRVGDGSPFPR